jgi:RHS repeat-associated protein
VLYVPGVGQWDGQAWTYELPDGLGSVRQLADAQGYLVQRYDYSPFGEALASEGKRTNSLRYTGEQWDSDVGLLYLRARWYDPYLNRWIQPDTIVPQPGNPQDLNRYSYTRNNPLKFVDPTGHSCVYVNGHMDCSEAGATSGAMTVQYTPDRPYIVGTPDEKGFWLTVGGAGAFAAVTVGGVVLAKPLITAALACANNPACKEKAVNTVQEALPSEEQAVQQAPQQLGTLRSIGQSLWESTAGLRYGVDPDPSIGNRVQHVLQHAADIPNRPGLHGVFNAGRSGTLAVIDEAWTLAQRGGAGVTTIQQGARTVYVVDMGRQIGYVGGQVGAATGNPVTNFVQLVIEGSNNMAHWELP